MKAVVADNLSKIYSGSKKAINRISLTLEQGEIFGFLGPNGAGKTTTIKLLNGMLSPSEGSCRVFDVDPAASPEMVHGMSGVITERAQMYDHLTGLQNLLLFGALFGISKQDSRQRAQELLSMLDLNDAGNKKLGTYSTGMRQRLSLARAMIHKPNILFLDEPTSGLDPESAKRVNQLICQLARQDGTTVFLCTHQLRYAEEICTCYGLVDQGELLNKGDLNQLRASLSTGLTVTVKADRPPKDMEYTKTGDLLYQLHVSSEQEVAEIARRIVDSGTKLYHISARQLTLEEIYFALIEQRRREGGQQDEYHADSTDQKGYSQHHIQ